jgi:hypothetical protein
MKLTRERDFIKFPFSLTKAFCSLPRITGSILKFNLKNLRIFIHFFKLAGYPVSGQISGKSIRLDTGYQNRPIYPA